MIKELKEKASWDHLTVIDNINLHLISSALRKMKPGKKDALFDSTSDYYVNGP